MFKSYFEVHFENDIDPACSSVIPAFQGFLYFVLRSVFDFDDYIYIYRDYNFDFDFWMFRLTSRIWLTISSILTDFLSLWL